MTIGMQQLGEAQRDCVAARSGDTQANMPGEILAKIDDEATRRWFGDCLRDQDPKRTQGGGGLCDQNATWGIADQG